MGGQSPCCMGPGRILAHGFLDPCQGLAESMLGAAWVLFSPLDPSLVFCKYQAGYGEVGTCFTPTKASEELGDTGWDPLLRGC